MSLIDNILVNQHASGILIRDRFSILKPQIDFTDKPEIVSALVGNKNTFDAVATGGYGPPSVEFGLFDF